MSEFTDAVERIGQHLKTFADEAVARVEQDLPIVANAASQMASNPAFAALSAAVHLNEAPEMLGALAEWITKADSALAAAKAAGAAEAQAAAAPPAEEAAPAA